MPGVGPGLPPPPSVHASYSGGPGPGPPPDQIPGPTNSLASMGQPGAAFFDELDPHNVPPELKKEGSDWFAVFNPKVKRVLDVNLVHTLLHERYASGLVQQSDDLLMGLVFAVWSVAFAFRLMGSSLPPAAIGLLRFTILRRARRLGVSGFYTHVRAHCLYPI